MRMLGPSKATKALQMNTFVDRIPCKLIVPFADQIHLPRLQIELSLQFVSPFLVIKIEVVIPKERFSSHKVNCEVNTKLT